MYVVQKVRQVSLVSLFGLSMAGCTSKPESIEISKVDLLQERVVSPMKDQSLMLGIKSTSKDVYSYKKYTCQSSAEISKSKSRIKATCDLFGGKLSAGKYCNSSAGVVSFSLANMPRQEIRKACEQPYYEVKNSLFCNVPKESLPIFYTEITPDRQITGAPGCLGKKYIFAELIPGNEEKWINYIDNRGYKSE